MSAFRLAIRRTAFQPRLAFYQRASFSSSIVRCAGKESALNHEGRADQIEAHKQDQLNKQKEGKGHWVDELASDSESVIKADRGEIDASQETINQLQQDTVKLAENANKKPGDK